MHPQHTLKNKKGKTNDNGHGEGCKCFTVFCLSFNGKNFFHIFQVPQHQGREWWNEVPSIIDQVKDHPKKLNIRKYMGPNEMHPMLLRELVNVVIKPFSSIFEKIMAAH